LCDDSLPHIPQNGNGKPLEIVLNNQLIEHKFKLSLREYGRE